MKKFKTSLIDIEINNLINKHKDLIKGYSKEKATYADPMMYVVYDMDGAFERRDTTNCILSYCTNKKDFLNWLKLQLN